MREATARQADVIQPSLNTNSWAGHQQRSAPFCTARSCHVDRIESYNMAGDMIDWGRAAQGAYDVLNPGGTFTFRWRGNSNDARVCEAALRKVGFKNVKNISDAIVTAKKPK